MLELLNQLDGFSSSEDVKVGRGRGRGSRRGVGCCREGTAGYRSLFFVKTVMGNRCGAALTPPRLTPRTADACHPPHQIIAATNRADILDPALMRSGRLDRKIEFPHPNEDARAKVWGCLGRSLGGRRCYGGGDYQLLARPSSLFTHNRTPRYGYEALPWTACPSPIHLSHTTSAQKMSPPLVHSPPPLLVPP